MMVVQGPLNGLSSWQIDIKRLAQSHNSHSSTTRPVCGNNHLLIHQYSLSYTSTCEEKIMLLLKHVHVNMHILQLQLQSNLFWTTEVCRNASFISLIKTFWKTFKVLQIRNGLEYKKWSSNIDWIDSITKLHTHACMYTLFTYSIHKSAYHALHILPGTLHIFDYCVPSVLWPHYTGLKINTGPLLQWVGAIF